MLQEKLQPQIERLKKLSDKAQKSLNQQLDIASEEGRKVLLTLGVDLEKETSLNAIINGLREQNPSLKAFLRNLDIATYDARFSLRWNSHMITAFTKNKAIDTFQAEVQPKIREYRASIQENLQELRDKVIKRDQAA